MFSRSLERVAEFALPSVQRGKAAVVTYRGFDVIGLLLCVAHRALKLSPSGLILVLSQEFSAEDVVGIRSLHINLCQTFNEGVVPFPISGLAANVEERQACYQVGGVCIAAARSVVADVMNGHLDPILISCIVVLQCEHLLSATAFRVKHLTRSIIKKNPDVMRVIVSDRPERLAGGGPSGLEEIGGVVGALNVAVLSRKSKAVTMMIGSNGIPPDLCSSENVYTKSCDPVWLKGSRAAVHGLTLRLVDAALKRLGKHPDFAMEVEPQLRSDYSRRFLDCLQKMRQEEPVFSRVRELVSHYRSLMELLDLLGASPMAACVRSILSQPQSSLSDTGPYGDLQREAKFWFNCETRLVRVSGKLTSRQQQRDLEITDNAPWCSKFIQLVSEDFEKFCDRLQAVDVGAGPPLVYRVVVIAKDLRHMHLVRNLLIEGEVGSSLIATRRVVREWVDNADASRKYLFKFDKKERLEILDMLRDIEGQEFERMSYGKPTAAFEELFEENRVTSPLGETCPRPGTFVGPFTDGFRAAAVPRCMEESWMGSNTKCPQNCLRVGPSECFHEHKFKASIGAREIGVEFIIVENKASRDTRFLWIHYPNLLRSLRPELVVSLQPSLALARAHEFVAALTASCYLKGRKRTRSESKQEAQHRSGQLIIIPSFRTIYTKDTSDDLVLLNLQEDEALKSLTEHRNRYRPQKLEDLDEFMDSDTQLRLLLSAGMSIGGRDETGWKIGKGPASSREGGGGAAALRALDLYKTTSIVIDSRELNAKLPYVLSDAGFCITVRTLVTADYVITRDVGIERKSIADLRGSLASGRLLLQARRMTATFPRGAALLIELTNRDIATWERTRGDVCGPLCRAYESPNVNSRISFASSMETWLGLLLVLRNNPKMKILWSCSERDTVAMFSVIKMGRPNPDLKNIVEEAEAEREKGNVVKRSVDNVTNQVALDFIRLLPGVNSINLPNLLAKIDKVADLLEITEDEVKRCMGGNEGQALYEFLHSTKDI